MNIDDQESQFDILCFYQNELCYFEVKFFEGEFSYNDDRWYLTRQKKEVSNPQHQLQRSERLLQLFLQQHQLKIQIKSLLIFANPNFHLYHAQENMPIIFPGQLNHFVKRLSSGNGHQNEFFKRIRRGLIQAHSPILRDKNDPVYEWGELRKGLFCSEQHCQQQLQRTRRDYLTCPSCKKGYSLEVCLLEAIRDFNVLFPLERITVSIIAKWIDDEVSHSFIYVVLKKNLNLIKNGSGSYYAF